jgi:hypothetical protein
MGTPGAAAGQDNYIRSLQQQIKILELEIAYLKKLPVKEGEEVQQKFGIKKSRS